MLRHMSTAVSFLAVGSELLDGRVVNSNAAFVCEELSRNGITMSEILVCDDDEDQIIRACRYLMEHSDFLLVSGGLGPTSDDLTREALARLGSIELVLNENVLNGLKALFERRKRPFSPSNRKQALFPAGSRIIPNPVGTAAGFLLELAGRKKIACLPGVPHELKAMFSQSVLPEILHLLQGEAAIFSTAMKIFGLPESLVGDRVAACDLDPAITVSYRASFPEIHLRLKTRSAQPVLQQAEKQIRESLGEEFIFSSDLQVPFEAILHDLLLKSGKTLSIAESCTGGMLGMYLTRTPGASSWFKGGVLVYSNELKRSLLDVPDALLKNEGAVSHGTARFMAQAARQRFASDYAVSITGIAGPGGGSEHKPCGTFFVGMSCAQGSFSFRHFAALNREMVRKYAAYSAMDTLRRQLLGFSIQGEGA